MHSVWSLRREHTNMNIFIRAQTLCFIIFIRCATCDLNLADGSSCVSEGLNGTCVSVYKCLSAAMSYTYGIAGYDIYDDAYPPLPVICTHNNKTPVICCTDCKIHDDELYKNYVVNIRGQFIRKPGPKAYDKCLDYLQRLPYWCRGKAGVRITKVLSRSGQCHLAQIAGWLAVGGRAAERWEFPHMALLGFGDDQESAQWVCGGSIISEKYILTAGHCVYSTSLGNVSFAALGILKRSDPLDYWKVFKIKRAIAHPEYKPPSKYHDIALLEIETEITFSEEVLPACLNTENTEEYTSEAEASGWGHLGHKNPLADTLQVVTIQEFPEAECSSTYPTHRHMKRGYDHSTQMCYGSKINITDTCQGDSGGPLQINVDKCQYIILGVTSFGRACGILGSPGIYTRVSHYVPWIESIVWPD